MSTTWTNIKARYDTQLLRQLTNINTPGASSINDTIGEYAVTDATQEFNEIVGKTYDSTDNEHLAAMYEFVIYILKVRGNKLGESAKNLEKVVYDRLRRLSKSNGARNRVTAMTSSPDQPTDDTRGGTVPNPLPEFDLTRFDGLTPGDPASADPNQNLPGMM